MGGSISKDRGIEVGVRVLGGGESKDLVEGESVVRRDGRSGEGAVLEIITKGGVLEEEIDEVGIEGDEIHDIGIFVVSIGGGCIIVIFVFLEAVIEETYEIGVL